MLVQLIEKRNNNYYGIDEDGGKVRVLKLSRVFVPPALPKKGDILDCTDLLEDGDEDFYVEAKRMATKTQRIKYKKNFS